MAHDDELSLDEWRAQRLQEAVDELDEGNKTKFAIRMGFKDGSYVGQLIRMARPITEKFILRFEVKTGKVGWFDRPISTFGGLEQQVRTELAVRDVPEHTLRTFLDAIRAYPPRRKAS